LSKSALWIVYFTPGLSQLMPVALRNKKITMLSKDFTTTIVVDQTPIEVFNAINNVRGWWSEEVQGETDKQGGEFDYHYQDVHRSKMKIIEFVPGKKVVWQVLDNYFKFTNDKNEWNGNTIVFEITEKNNKTELRFTQVGLVPEYECFDICRKAWGNYISNSLYKLITTGKGEPNPKEGGFNEELVREHQLS
jgi:hypothetical protein